VLKKMVDANVSLAALWVEDWCGAFTDSQTGSVQVAYNWVLDRTHYPNWDEIVDTAHAAAARVMVYANPFLIWTPTKAEGGNATRNLYDEAYYWGYLVGYNSANYTGPYVSLLITRPGAMVDMSNPYAVQWYKEVIKTEVYTNARASGYMADFGEWLPYRYSPNPALDVQLFNRQDPLSFHNEYTDIWAGLHKDAVSQWNASLNGSTPINAEPVVMVRTGYLKAPGNAQLFWLGDQTVLWDNHDGLASALTGMLSGGMSGFSLTHSDVGGYAGVGFAKLAFLKLCRTKNILLRWTEMNAFSAVFRTHQGNAPASNFQVWSDSDTMSQFARFARLFAFMAPYRKLLMGEAQEKGWPMVRPLFFHHPGDSKTHQMNTQFLLGENILVAPVLTSKLKYKRVNIIHIEYIYAALDVYLPRGNWTLLWDPKETYTATGETIKVEVKFGKPAVFYKTGWDYGERLSSFVNTQLESEFPALTMTDTTINKCS